MHNSHESQLQRVSMDQALHEGYKSWHKTDSVRYSKMLLFSGDRMVTVGAL